MQELYIFCMVDFVYMWVCRNCRRGGQLEGPLERQQT